MARITRVVRNTGGDVEFCSELTKMTELQPQCSNKYLSKQERTFKSVNPPPSVNLRNKLNGNNNRIHNQPTNPNPNPPSRKHIKRLPKPFLQSSKHFLIWKRSSFHSRVRGSCELLVHLKIDHKQIIELLFRVQSQCKNCPCSTDWDGDKERRD